MSGSSSQTKSSKKPGGRSLRRLSIALIAGIFFLLVAAAGILPLFRPASSEHRTVDITFRSGTNVRQAAEVLEQHGILRSAAAFDWYLRMKSAHPTIRAARYRFSPDMRLGQVLQELQSGGINPQDERIRVTIPEGFTLKQIAHAFAEKGVLKERDFLAIATTPAKYADFHTDFPLPAKTLEGYLFPDTYFFPAGVPAGKVIEEMLSNFDIRYYRLYRQELGPRRRSLHQIVTEASLVEREAKVPEDRARIAGVIENRLQQGMRLEVDATVLYALGHHKNRVLFRDLEVDSPYNTYRHRGLPPGPIASPGLAALLAALRPEKCSFIYYVARPDGSHLFSNTLAEHEAAKERARAERRASAE